MMANVGLYFIYFLFLSNFWGAVQSGVWGETTKIKAESRRDDSVVKGIAYTTEASLRDAEIWCISFRALRCASCPVKLSASSGLVYQAFPLNSTALSARIGSLPIN